VPNRGSEGANTTTDDVISIIAVSACLVAFAACVVAHEYRHGSWTLIPTPPQEGV
jgi:hypothetical protein